MRSLLRFVLHCWMNHTLPLCWSRRPLNHILMTCRSNSCRCRACGSACHVVSRFKGIPLSRRNTSHPLRGSSCGEREAFCTCSTEEEVQRATYSAFILCVCVYSYTVDDVFWKGASALFISFHRCLYRANRSSCVTFIHMIRCYVVQAKERRMWTHVFAKGRRSDPMWLSEGLEAGRRLQELCGWDLKSSLLTVLHNPHKTPVFQYQFLLNNKYYFQTLGASMSGEGMINVTNNLLVWMSFIDYFPAFDRPPVKMSRRCPWWRRGRVCRLHKRRVRADLHEPPGGLQLHLQDGVQGSNRWCHQVRAWVESSCLKAQVCVKCH